MEIKSILLQSFDEVILNLVIQEVDNPKGLVIINHGFSEHVGRYNMVANKLNESGYIVCRYDLRGHGKTVSRKGYIKNYNDFIEDLKCVIEYLEKKYVSINKFILGHSMGGFISVIYGIMYPNTVNGYILSGPALYNLKQSKSIYGIALRSAYRMMPNLQVAGNLEDVICSVPEVVAANKKDPRVLKKASISLFYQFLCKGSIFIKKNQSNFREPVLLLHGMNDKIVPVGVSQDFFNRIQSKDKTINTYPKLYHEIFNEKEGPSIMDTVVEWLEKRIV